MSHALLIGEVAGVATAAGVLVAAWQLYRGQSIERTRFEDSLTSQYREGVRPKLLAQGLLPEGRAEALAPFYVYFDLSNEQAFLRLGGRIRTRTWVDWAEGIAANLEHRAPAKNAWQEIHAHAPNDFKELQLLMVRGYDDPRQWLPRLRWPWSRCSVDDAAARLLRARELDELPWQKEAP